MHRRLMKYVYHTIPERHLDLPENRVPVRLDAEQDEARVTRTPRLQGDEPTRGRPERVFYPGLERLLDLLLTHVEGPKPHTRRRRNLGGYTPPRTMYIFPGLGIRYLPRGRRSKTSRNSRASGREVEMRIFIILNFSFRCLPEDVQQGLI